MIDYAWTEAMRHSSRNGDLPGPRFLCRVLSGRERATVNGGQVSIHEMDQEQRLSLVPGSSLALSPKVMPAIWELVYFNSMHCAVFEAVERSGPHSLTAHCSHVMTQRHG